jgi:hypothetical protein
MASSDCPPSAKKLLSWSISDWDKRSDQMPVISRSIDESLVDRPFTEPSASTVPSRAAERSARPSFRLLHQTKPLHLPRRSLWQIRNEINLGRRLEVTEMAFAKTEEFPFVAARPGPESREGHHVLAVAPVASGTKHSKTAKSKFSDVEKRVCLSSPASRKDCAQQMRLVVFLCSIATALGPP